MWIRSSKQERVDTEAAKQDYEKRGKHLSGVIVTMSGSTRSKDPAAVAAELATILEVPVENISEVLEYENTMTIGLGARTTHDMTVKAGEL